MQKNLNLNLEQASVIFENVSLRIPIFNKRLFSLKKNINLSTDLVGVKKGSENGNLYSEILSDISFEINDNDSVGILGHNGSGKTTLLKVISGIYHPDIGNVKVDWKNISLSKRAFYYKT